MSKTADSSTQTSEVELFKFRKVNKRLIDSLVMSHLWCAKPDTLNDPLDCQINLRNSWIRATSLAVGKKKEWLERILKEPQLLEQLEKPLRESGICAFSLHLTHPLYSSVQWAHYADEHKGVCLLYRFPASYINDPSNQLVGVSGVTYKDNELTNWLVGSPMDMDEFLEGFIKKFLTIKSPAWEYEQEVRIIRKTLAL